MRILNGWDKSIYVDSASMHDVSWRTAGCIGRFRVEHKNCEKHTNTISAHTGGIIQRINSHNPNIHEKWYHLQSYLHGGIRLSNLNLLTFKINLSWCVHALLIALRCMCKLTERTVLKVEQNGRSKVFLDKQKLRVHLFEETFNGVVVQSNVYRTRVCTRRISV